MITLTIHASRPVQERAIPPAWIKATITSPDRTAPDVDPALTHSFKSIPEAGGRVLKVVHRPAGSDVSVMTVHLDRRAKS